MARRNFVTIFLYSDFKWTGTLVLDGAEVPIELTTVPYFEDVWDYVLYRTDTPKGDPIGEAWIRNAPDGSWYLDIKVDQPESYFRLNRETEERWVLTKIARFRKPEREPEPETYPSHAFDRPNRSLCDRCGETYHIDNLDECRECRADVCYRCGQGGLCNGCAGRLKAAAEKTQH